MVSAHPLTDADHEKACKRMVEALDAVQTVRYRDPKTGKIDYREVPDWRFRLPAAIKIAELKGGKAVSMNLTANLTPGQPPEDTLKAVMDTPEGRKSMAEVARKWAIELEKANAIDLPPDKPLPPPENPSS